MAARIEIITDTATPALARVLSRLSGTAARQLMDHIGESLVRSTRDRGQHQVSPNGAAWAPLSRAYKKRKHAARPGVPMLRFDFHMLGDRLVHQVEDNGASVQIGTNVKYGAIHQFGGTINIPAQTRMLSFRHGKGGQSRFEKKGSKLTSRQMSVTIPAHKVSIPARPWLGLSDQDRLDIEDIAAEHLETAIRGG